MDEIEDIKAIKDLENNLSIAYFILHQMITLNNGFLQSYNRYMDGSNAAARNFKNLFSTTSIKTFEDIKNIPGFKLSKSNILSNITYISRKIKKECPNEEKCEIYKIVQIIEIILSNLDDFFSSQTSGGSRVSKCILCKNCK